MACCLGQCPASCRNGTKRRLSQRTKSRSAALAAVHAGPDPSSGLQHNSSSLQHSSVLRPHLLAQLRLLLPQLSGDGLALCSPGSNQAKRRGAAGAAADGQQHCASAAVAVVWTHTAAAALIACMALSGRPLAVRMQKNAVRAHPRAPAGSCASSRTAPSPCPPGSCGTGTPS